ncbi:hypothetical protein, partial [Ligilactobacillus ruminis]
ASFGECKHSVKESFVRLACIRHAASVRPEPGSNSQFIVCDSKFTSELTSQILLLLFKTRSPAHLLIETLFSFQRSVLQVARCDFLSISSTNYLVNNFLKVIFDSI